MAGTAKAERPWTASRETYVIEFRSLWEAWRACRRRKGGTRDCLRYSGRLLDRLSATQAALQADTWRPSRTRVFVTTRPKAREIHAPCFADRVVHHWLVPQLEALYEPAFIHDSYANRKGKGTHTAVARLQTFMRQATSNGEQRAYALQLDIANCFNSIDRRRLFSLIHRKIERASERNPDESARYRHLGRVTRRLLTGNPGLVARRIGRPDKFDRVPHHKRLANAQPEHGLPIGNLSSQFFANVYLDQLDQFVKHELKVKRYLRYVDDFVLIDTDAARLYVLRDAIVGFLIERLGLRLRSSDVDPVPVSKGVDFLGYIVRPFYLLPRRRVVQAANLRVRQWRDRLVSGEGLRIDTEAQRALRNCLGSYVGHLRHCSGFRAAARLWSSNRWLTAIIGLEGLTTVQCGEAPIVTHLASQYTWLKARFPGAFVWLQVGSHWECYDEDARVLAARYKRTLAVTPRRGFTQTLSLRRDIWEQIRQRMIRDHIRCVSAVQRGWLPGHRHTLRRRALEWVSHAELVELEAEHLPLTHPALRCEMLADQCATGILE